MTRRFIQINGELIEVTGEGRDRARGADHILWNDRAYQDMNDPRFSSRSQHRDYMKRNNLSTVDDYTQQWKRAEEKRDQFRTKGTDASRRADIVRALEKSK